MTKKRIYVRDVIGKTFNDLTIIAEIKGDKKPALCRCICGTEKQFITNEVTSGHAKSCGCRKERGSMSRIGERYGMLTVTGLRKVKAKRSFKNVLVCRCDCGNVTEALGSNLDAGTVKSCGCLRATKSAEIIGERFGKRVVIANSGSYSTCRCDCGRVDEVLTLNLRNGVARSCLDCGVSSGLDHPSALSLDEVRARLTKHWPRYSFPNLEDDWGGKGSNIRGLCPDHGEFCRYVATGDAIFTCIPCRQCADAADPNRLIHGTSSGEESLRAFVETLCQTTKGYIDPNGTWSFDIIIPDRKIVIEYNGVHWHSFPRAKRGQHSHKRKFAEKRGYRMITIWEDQWLFDRERIERYLTRALCGVERRIAARSCMITVTDRETAHAFHEAHHLQGAEPSGANIHVGLSLRGEIVAMASFDRKGVLHRYTVGNCAVIGGLRKILKAANFPEVTTYCDRDHFTGGVYRESGFAHEGGTLQLTYVTGGRRVNRRRFQKHLLPELFGEVDMTMPEHEICASFGVYAAWNSGIEKWVWRHG